MPTIGEVKNGQMWNGRSWVAIGGQQMLPAGSKGIAPKIPTVGASAGYLYPGDVPVKPQIGRAHV